MRYFLMMFLVCALALPVLFEGPARAQRHAGYCDRADSTAAALDCVNRHHKDAQDDLNALFGRLLEEQENNAAKALLADAQTRWIGYRDAQCGWEAALAQNPSLNRVYELSCLTALTESRSALLDAVRTREDDPAPREFGARPRWMNALAEDYPDIFWRYGGWKSADMDCDGEDERIMTGIAVASIQEVKVGESAAVDVRRNVVDLVLAVSENPSAGRPKADIVRLPVDKDAGGPHLCTPGVRLDIVDVLDEKGCKTLRVSDGLCPPVTLEHDGAAYILTLSESVKKQEVPR